MRACVGPSPVHFRSVFAYLQPFEPGPFFLAGVAYSLSVDMQVFPKCFLDTVCALELGTWYRISESTPYPITTECRWALATGRNRTPSDRLWLVPTSCQRLPTAMRARRSASSRRAKSSNRYVLGLDWDHTLARARIGPVTPSPSPRFQDLGLGVSGSCA
jgi:hypothetical protein